MMDMSKRVKIEEEKDKTIEWSGDEVWRTVEYLRRYRFLDCMECGNRETRLVEIVYRLGEEVSEIEAIFWCPLCGFTGRVELTPNGVEDLKREENIQMILGTLTCPNCNSGDIEYLTTKYGYSESEFGYRDYWKGKVGISRTTTVTFCPNCGDTIVLIIENISEKQAKPTYT